MGVGQFFGRRQTCWARVPKLWANVFHFYVVYFHENFQHFWFFLFQITAKAAVIFVTLQYNVTIPATGMYLAGG